MFEDIQAECAYISRCVSEIKNIFQISVGASKHSSPPQFTDGSSSVGGVLKLDLE